MGPSQEREGRGLPSSLGPGTESGHCPPGSAPGASGQGLEQTAVLPTEGWKGEPGKPAGCEQISPQRMLGTGLTRGAPCGGWTRGLGRRGRGAAESQGRTSSRAWQMGCGAREPGPGFQAWGQDSWGQISIPGWAGRTQRTQPVWPRRAAVDLRMPLSVLQEGGPSADTAGVLRLGGGHGFPCPGVLASLDTAALVVLRAGASLPQGWSWKGSLLGGEAGSQCPH